MNHRETQTWIAQHGRLVPTFGAWLRSQPPADVGQLAAPWARRLSRTPLGVAFEYSVAAAHRTVGHPPSWAYDQLPELVVEYDAERTARRRRLKRLHAALALNGAARLVAGPAAVFNVFGRVWPLRLLRRLDERRADLLWQLGQVRARPWGEGGQNLRNLATASRGPTPARLPCTRFKQDFQRPKE